MPAHLDLFIHSVRKRLFRSLTLFAKPLHRRLDTHVGGVGVVLAGRGQQDV